MAIDFGTVYPTTMGFVALWNRGVVVPFFPRGLSASLGQHAAHFKWTLLRVWD